MNGAARKRLPAAVNRLGLEPAHVARLSRRVLLLRLRDPAPTRIQILRNVSRSQPLRVCRGSGSARKGAEAMTAITR